jgi:hypothetical protein
MQRRSGLAHASLALAASTLFAEAPAAADAGVVVIRGANVSVARPLIPERALDGRAEVEIVRVEAAPAPAASPAPREPERDLVVILVPVADPGPIRLGVPIPWGAPCPWGGWPGLSLPHPDRHDLRSARVYFPPSFHPVGIHRGPVHRGLRARSAQVAARGLGW